MKKILYFIAIATLIVSCESYNEQFDGYDDNDITYTDEIKYTLTEDDYATVNESLTTYLTSDYPDTIAIPIVLDNVYPTLDDGSIVYATFNYYTGDNIAYIDSINAWKANGAYVLTSDDYDGMGTSYGKPGYYNNFSSSVDPDDYLPDFLNELYEDESDNFSTIISYQYYASSVTSTVLAKYTLSISEATADESYTLTSDDYDGMGTEYGKPGYYNNFSSSVPPEDYLPDFLANKYSGITDGYIVAVTYKYYNSGTTNKTDYYKYSNSSWSKVELRSWTSSSSVTLSDDVTDYSLTDEDYNAMGISNFNAAAPAENYIPTFLSSNYLYAQEGDKIAVLYKYKGDEILTQAIEYVYTDGEWIATGYTTTDTQQYVKTDGKWTYVGATLYTMSKGTKSGGTGEDYQMIVDYVSKKYGSSYINDYGTGDTYYGADAYYGEFHYESKYWNGDVFDSCEDAISEALAVAFLPSKYPDAAVDDEFVITFSVYNDGMYDYTASFICTAAGDTPAFKVTSAPAAE